VDWMWLGFLVMSFGALLILAPRRAQKTRANHVTFWYAATALGSAGMVAIVGKAILHMPISAGLATLALCGLTVGMAGLACYSLLHALLGCAARTRGQQSAP
jgi:hypothetical protein